MYLYTLNLSSKIFSQILVSMSFKKYFKIFPLSILNRSLVDFSGVVDFVEKSVYDVKPYSKVKKMDL